LLHSHTLQVNEFEDQFVNAQAELEQMNNEVFEVLPTFYDGRITFYGQHFQTMFGMLSAFHETCAGTSNDLAVAMDELFVEVQSLYSCSPCIQLTRVLHVFDKRCIAWPSLLHSIGTMATLS